jgi:hypothetical protein
MNAELWKLVVVLVFVLLFMVIVANATNDARKAALDALRHAIDKGQPLDPNTVNQLLGRREPNPRFLMFPGIMALATGIGLGIASLFTLREDLIVGSAVLICSGIGLMVSAQVLTSAKRSSGAES